MPGMLRPEFRNQIPRTVGLGILIAVGSVMEVFAQNDSPPSGSPMSAEDGFYKTLLWLGVAGFLCMGGLIAIWKLRKYLEDEGMI
ncbi:MAG: hypothetical protein QF752_03860 [Planctomycetota bacterium]|nr:hypothetical protein [Planctomycetota bacterium]